MAWFRSRESKYLADFRNTTELFAVDERPLGHNHQVG
jgi:hypothetical protein